jgi:NADH:ubiquinone oxidoreductase subunit 6 (subunit J)
MKIIQILILIGMVVFIVISCVNIMDGYSKEAKENFRSERNWKICITIIIFILLYFAGTFNLVFPHF